MILRLREWQWSDPLRLNHGQVAALERSDMFDVAPRFGGEVRWVVRARQHVGVGMFGDLEVRIEPKVPVDRLLPLLAWSQERIRWDDQAQPELGQSDDLAVVLAGAFTAAAERVARGGFVQGYRVVEEALPTVRGRMLVGAQMSRRAGMPLPVELRFDEFTTDVVENQLVVGAARVLAAVPSLPVALRRRLRRLTQLLAEVTPARPMPTPPSVVFTRLNERYRDVVPLARMALRNAAMDVDGLGTAGVGFLVDMNRVFEDVVGERKRAALEPQGLTVHLQNQTKLDRDGHVDIRPDLLVKRGSEVVEVADVKYKAPDRHGVNTSDLYQALAYAHRFGLDRVGLIYASPPPYEELVVGDVTVQLSWVDLTKTAS